MEVKSVGRSVGNSRGRTCPSLDAKRRDVDRRRRRLFKGLEKLESRALLAAYPVYIGGNLTFGDDTADAPYGLENTFRLESLPSADFTIALDFTGHITRSEIRDPYSSRDQVNWPAYNNNDDRPDGFASFTDQELAEIQRLWQGVAEDYAPFNVNVTTVETPRDKIVKDGPNDTQYGFRAIVTQPVNGASGGGYANGLEPNFEVERINLSFNRDSATISHETGHNFAVAHTGTVTPPGVRIDEYQGIIGQGEARYIPIMGSSGDAHSGGLSQWSNGNYEGAVEYGRDGSVVPFTDQIAKIGAITGFRSDDHGGTAATATPINFDANLLGSQWGFIDAASDQDHFSFSSSGGKVDISLSPFEQHGNLDSAIALYRFNEDGSGTFIAADNPDERISSRISTTVAAGNYIIIVDGVKSPFNTSDYGSLGFYDLEVQLEKNDVSVDLEQAGNVPLIPFENTNVVVGDFNGDGLDDFIRQEKGPWDDDDVYTFHLDISRGNGTFNRVGLDSLNWVGGDSHNLIVGDFNGDGKDDFLRQRKLQPGENLSGSMLAVYISEGQSFSGFSVSTTNNQDILNGNSSTLHVGDFNGDGRDDFLRQGTSFVSGQEWSQLFTADPSGLGFTQGSLANSHLLRGDLNNVFVGDFDNDGIDDFIKQEKGFWDDDDFNTAIRYRSNGNGTFTRRNLPDLNVLKGDDTNLLIGDFNGDGRDDILRQEIGFADGINGNNASVFFSDGIDFSQTMIPRNSWLPGHLNNLLVGDFDGDGRDDFLRQQLTDGERTADFWISEGTGEFRQIGDFEGLQGGQANLHVGDFNGDGRSDLIRQQSAAVSFDGNVYLSSSSHFTFTVGDPTAYWDLPETGTGTISAIPIYNESAGQQAPWTDASNGGAILVNDSGVSGFWSQGDFEDLPFGESRNTWLRYEVQLPDGTTSIKTAVVTVNGSAPNTLDDTFSISADPSIEYRFFNPLGNDLLAPGVTATIIAVDGNAGLVGQNYQSPNGGSFYTFADGRIVFSTADDFGHLDPGEVGASSITYTVQDSNGRVSEATMTVIVEGFGPSAMVDRLTFDEDSFNGSFSYNVLNNDQRPSGATLTVTKVDGETSNVGRSYNGLRGGSFWLSADGSLAFGTNGNAVPDEVGDFNWLGDGQSTDTWITYTVEDQDGSTSVGTVVITINGKGRRLAYDPDNPATSENPPERWLGSGVVELAVASPTVALAGFGHFHAHPGHAHPGHAHHAAVTEIVEDDPTCNCQGPCQCAAQFLAGTNDNTFDSAQNSDVLIASDDGDDPNCNCQGPCQCAAQMLSGSGGVDFAESKINRLGVEQMFAQAFQGSSSTSSVIPSRLKSSIQQLALLELIDSAESDRDALRVDGLDSKNASIQSISHNAGTQISEVHRGLSEANKDRLAVDQVLANYDLEEDRLNELFRWQI